MNGWRGIGVPVETVRSPADDTLDAWIAVANDPQDGRPGVSVWVSPDGWASREAAFWMKPQGARDLALALLALAERAEA